MPNTQISQLPQARPSIVYQPRLEHLTVVPAGCAAQDKRASWMVVCALQASMNACIPASSFSSILDAAKSHIVVPVCGIVPVAIGAPQVVCWIVVCAAAQNTLLWMPPTINWTAEKGARQIAFRKGDSYSQSWHAQASHGWIAVCHPVRSGQRHSAFAASAVDDGHV